MKGVHLLILALLTAASSNAWSASVVLDGVHVSRNSRATLVTFIFSRTPPLFREFALSSPPRAVLDMLNTRDALSAHQFRDPAVRELRMARHRNGTLRAVINLRTGAQLLGVKRRGHHELVMSIRSAGKAARHDHTAGVMHSPEQTASSSHPLSQVSVKPAAFHAVPQAGPIVVVIDPGHGGKDPGTIGPDGLREKTVTLAIAKILYHELGKEANIEPILTRSRDIYVSLPERVAIAQQHRANLFVSIHENAYRHDPGVEGGTCYILSTHGASDAKAAQLARFENSADPALDGVHFTRSRTVNRVLTDLFQTASINAEDHLAQDIIAQMGHVESLYHRAPERANFAVLRDPMIPSVLCETAFLSNPREARELRRHLYRVEIATAIDRGILRYLHSYAPMRIEPDHPQSYLAGAGANAAGGALHGRQAASGLAATGRQGAQKTNSKGVTSADSISRRGGAAYTVKHGDTLSSIAVLHHTTVDRLISANHLQGPQLRPGETLNMPTGPEPTARQNVRTVEYTVQQGDALSVIALRYHATVTGIQRMNHLESSRIHAGQKLRVPAGRNQFGRYVVQAGDTVSQLAAQYGVTADRLEKINHLDGAGIQIGEVLLVPHNAETAG